MVLSLLQYRPDLSRHLVCKRVSNFGLRGNIFAIHEPSAIVTRPSRLSRDIAEGAEFRLNPLLISTQAAPCRQKNTFVGQAPARRRSRCRA